MLPSANHVRKILIVCDDNQLEVILLPPGCHEQLEGVPQAGTVFCSGRQVIAMGATELLGPTGISHWRRIVMIIHTGISQAQPR